MGARFGVPGPGTDVIDDGRGGCGTEGGNAVAPEGRDTKGGRGSGGVTDAPRDAGFAGGIGVPLGGNPDGRGWVGTVSPGTGGVDIVGRGGNNDGRTGVARGVTGESEAGAELTVGADAAGVGCDARGGAEGAAPNGMVDRGGSAGAAACGSEGAGGAAGGIAWNGTSGGSYDGGGCVAPDPA